MIGGLLGIDFGYSFGIHIQFLPFPELIPFRLTRQMSNVLLPLQVSADRPSPLAMKMAKCLAAWRNHASTIGKRSRVIWILDSVRYRRLMLRFIETRNQ